MPNVKTWFSEANFSAPDVTTAALLGKSVLWTIKAMLVGNVGAVTQGRWTVVGSSDGATAALDGTDRWLATFDATKIVQAGVGVAHSWIVLKSPDALGPYWMILDYSTGSTPYQLTVSYSKVAPTGGTITNRPTATNETVLPSDTAQRCFCRQAAGTATRLHFTRTAAGEFMIMINTAGLSRFTSIFAMLEASDVRPGDTYNLVGFLNSDNPQSTTVPWSGVLADHLAANASYTTLNNTLAFTAITSLSTTLGGLIAMRRYNGAAGVAASGCALMPASFGGQSQGSNAGAAPWNTSANVQTSQNGATGGTDAADSLYNVLPIYLAGVGFVKGRLVDFGWAPQAAPEGSVDSAGTPTRMIVGDWSVPWTSTTVPVL